MRDGRRGRVGRGAVLVTLAALALAGCTPADQGAVTLDADRGTPRYVTALCDGESLTSLTLERTGRGTEPGGIETGGGEAGADDRVLWRIEAATPRPVTEVTAGVVPDGFTETTPLAPGPLAAEMEFVPVTEGGPGDARGQDFALADLTPGTLLQNGREVTLDDLDDHAHGNCGGLLALLGLPSWTGGAVVVLVLGAVVGYAGLLVALARRGRRARRRHATPPPWPSG